jgi:hypothetical protein
VRIKKPVNEKLTDNDSLVKSNHMAKLKVPYTRRSDFSDKKSYM